MRTLAAVLAAGLFFITPAGAVRGSRKRHAAKPVVFTVTPSDAIEERVSAESEKARDIIGNLSISNLFDSPYLSAAIYYHDGFLSDFPDEKPEADPARRIVARLQRDLTPERKLLYVHLVQEYWHDRAFDAGTPAPAFVVPVPYERPAPVSKPRKRFRWRRARSSTHEYAVDLFANEGTPVRAATRGVVVVADRGWAPAEPFSTTSQKGGNSVIVFDPDNQRFLRYAHLDEVLVSPGGTVQAGERIGTVGHTGLNANLPKHGRHVHLEVNAFVDGRTKPFHKAELWRMIHDAEDSRNSR